MKWQIHRLRVDPDNQGLRLDQFLAARVADLSRSTAKKIIDLGGVHLDGRRVRSCSSQVTEGDQVEVYLDHLPLEPFRLLPAQVIYQDQYLIVINKPAQVETQPTHARFKGTLYEALQFYLQDPTRPRQKPELGMIQRLDRGTSGLMLFSTHQRAHKPLTEAFSSHQVVKIYQALVGGHPRPFAGEIRSLLARSRKENRVHSVAKGGKEAVTHYRTLASCDQASLVELELLTGRSHQIRAHMAEKDCPLLGDRRYGGRVELVGQKLLRPLLHACRLAFPHPISGEALDFHLPLPDDMSNLKTALNLSSNQG